MFVIGGIKVDLIWNGLAVVVVVVPVESPIPPLTRKRFARVPPEKAFLNASKAEECFKNLAKNYAETIQTPTANIQCICERGIFEIDVED